jgi:CheY-like chemotaxis protein
MEVRVLVLEDDAAVAALLAGVLTEEGYTVTGCSSPQDGLALLRCTGPHAFQLVLSNPFAPPQDPYAFLEQLRPLTAAPIVICSAAPALFAQSQTRGYAAFLAAPFNLNDLLTVVQALCPVPAPGDGGQEPLPCPTADPPAE